jgi:hypothetical protein
MGFLFARCELLYWCFIGVDHAMFKHSTAQGIDQRLQLHPTVADPLRQVGRAMVKLARLKIDSWR